MARTMARALAGVALVLSAEAACINKVKLEIFMETGCGFCKDFVDTTLAQTLSLPGMGDIVNLDISAFGNCFFPTQQCGSSSVYDPNIRKCFNKVCGRDATNKPSDCFTGELVCQHGQAEIIGNRYFECAKKETNGDLWSFLPFAVCVEDHDKKSMVTEASWTPVIDICAAKAGLNAASLTTCATGSEAKQLMIAEAAKTPMHTVAPLVLLNGKEINPDSLLQELCNAVTGPKPEGCTQRGLLLA